MIILLDIKYAFNFNERELVYLCILFIFIHVIAKMFWQERPEEGIKSYQNWSYWQL